MSVDEVIVRGSSGVDGGTAHARAALTCLLATALTMGCGPFLLLPGGELAGQSAPAPASWDFIADISTVQIETRPADPYSVNIWAVGMGNVVYIHAGDNRASWVTHLEEDPALRLRVGSDIFSLRAERVTTQEEFDRFSDAYEEKFGLRPGNENVGQVYLFRLEARTR